MGQLAPLNEADDKQAAREDDRAEVRNGSESGPTTSMMAVRVLWRSSKRNKKTERCQPRSMAAWPPGRFQVPWPPVLPLRRCARSATTAISHTEAVRNCRSARACTPRLKHVSCRRCQVAVMRGGVSFRSGGRATPAGCCCTFRGGATPGGALGSHRLASRSAARLSRTFSSCRPCLLR